MGGHVAGNDLVTLYVEVMADEREFLGKRFEPSEVIDVVEVDEFTLPAQMAVAGPEIESRHEVDEALEVVQARELRLRQLEDGAFAGQDLFGPAGHQAIPRIAHEGELEIVSIELGGVTNEAGVLDVERHGMSLEVVKNRPRAGLGHSIPQESLLVGDGQIVGAGGRQHGYVGNRLQDELRESGGAVQ